ncbi:MAG: TetR/AcrR family transcriptional regulator [Clostridia bacterium]
MRIVKEAKERENEILDAASILFSEKGFDGTSIADILLKVGIARGTLYYHFKSKEDMMNALIERTTTQMLCAAKNAAELKLPVIDRIVNVVLSLNTQENCGDEMLAHMHSPQNALMHQKTQKAILTHLTPVLADLIREGINQGVFHTEFPYECMEMVMTYALVAFDDDDTIALTEESKVLRIGAFIYNVERLLGAEKGSFAPAMMRMFSGGN